MLDLLELDLGGSANLDHGNAAGELGETLLELLTVKLGIGVLDLTLDLGDALVDGLPGASARDDGGGVLGDLDGLGATEHLSGGVGDLDAELLHGDLAAGKDGDVLEHALTTIAIARGLHGGDLQGATELVEDQGGESLAVDVLAHDEEGGAGLLHGLEDREDVLDVGDLLIRHQDVGVLELSDHGGVVGREVRGDVALVELHALDGVNGDAEVGLVLVNGDDAVLAHDLHGIGDLLANLRVRGGDGADGSDLLLGVDVLGGGLHGVDDGGDGLVDTATDGQRISTGGDVAEALVHDDLGEERSGGGAVTHGVVGLGSDLLHELSTHVLDGILELDLLGDGDAVIGDRGGTEVALEGDVAALGAHGGGNGISQGVNALGELGTSIGAERNVLGHWWLPFELTALRRVLARAVEVSWNASVARERTRPR